MRRDGGGNEAACRPMEIFCWLNPVPAVSIMLAPWPRLSILIIFGAELKKRGGGNNYVWRVLGQATVDITRLPSPLAAVVVAASSRCRRASHRAEVEGARLQRRVVGALLHGTSEQLQRSPLKASSRNRAATPTGATRHNQ